MLAFDPTQLARWTSGKWTSLPVVPLRGFSIDSRGTRAGEVFVALKSATRDGHDFVAAAAAQGAAAALVAVANPSLSLPQLVVADPLTSFQAIAREHRRVFSGPVVGITGSAGKTSTKNLLTLLLGGSAPGEPVLSTEGNLNNHLGVPLTLTRLDPARHRFAVIEAGISAPGDMSTLASMIEPDLALTTLIGPAHIKELGSLEGVACEKSRLSASVRSAGVAIFPAQCAGFGPFRELGVRRMVIEPAEVLRPVAPPADRVYFVTTQGVNTTTVALAYGDHPPLTFTFCRVTDGMAQNAVLAIYAALRLGVSRDEIQARLAAYAPGPMRGEWRNASENVFYLDCYNANPASMHDALGTFCSVAPQTSRRLFVLGGMEELGPLAANHHRELGRALALRPGDEVVTIGDHAAEVFAGALERGNQATAVAIATDLSDIADRINRFSGAIFVKGSRRYQLERALPATLVPAPAHV